MCKHIRSLSGEVVFGQRWRGTRFLQSTHTAVFSCHKDICINPKIFGGGVGSWSKFPIVHSYPHYPLDHGSTLACCDLHYTERGTMALHTEHYTV